VQLEQNCDTTSKALCRRVALRFEFLTIAVRRLCVFWPRANANVIATAHGSDAPSQLALGRAVSGGDGIDKESENTVKTIELTGFFLQRKTIDLLNEQQQRVSSSNSSRAPRRPSKLSLAASTAAERKSLTNCVAAASRRTAANSLSRARFAADLA
jgi:hypothetical protein